MHYTRAHSNSNLSYFVLAVFNGDACAFALHEWEKWTCNWRCMLKSAKFHLCEWCFWTASKANDQVDLLINEMLRFHSNEIVDFIVLALWLPFMVPKFKWIYWCLAGMRPFEHGLWAPMLECSNALMSKCKIIL